jgi:glycyl-tRNA synthetase
MELEFFCKPGTDLEWFAYWKQYCHDFLLSLGMKEESIRLRDHGEDELSFYSNATTDIEFLFPFGWGELWGIADRTDFDLKQHIEHSGQDLSYRDPETNEKYVPYVIEPSLGADRILLAFLVNAYEEESLSSDEKSTDDVRTVLHLHPALAPYKAAVLPLMKKQAEKAEALYAELSKDFMVDYDVSANIGKRYRRQDEIGTPYCITVDFDTEEDDSVTVRDRDTMEQIRVKIPELKDWLAEKIKF